jgi:hypothetical protein
MNDYLKEYEESNVSSWSPRAYHARKSCTEKYGFAIPTDEVVKKIVSFGKIIEMGAGTGYWARLISEAGGDIVAFDKDPVYTGRNFYKFRESWWHVVESTPAILALKKYADRTLFLCWPSYGTPFGADCLKAYQGDTFLYVGEGHYGCCGDKKFWSILDKEWEEDDDEYMSIPQWDGIHDYFTVYRRK